MERIINRSMSTFLHQHGLISSSQHGFRPNHSTASNLLESVSDLYLNLDKRSPTDVIYFDFSKAFDSVSHPKLLTKLRAYGLTGPLLGWLTSFLTDRHQYIAFDGATSDLFPVTSGVPQGSVLGPSLFLIFINDICDIQLALDVIFKLFADDLKVYALCDSHCNSRALIDTLSLIEEWSAKWQLPLAIDKCSSVHFGKRPTIPTTPVNHNYLLFSAPLASSSTIKDLGVLFDNQLKFDAHIASVVHKALTRSKLILRCFYSRNRSLLVKAYITYVRPLLEYCSVVWAPHFNYLSDKVESVQRFYTKRIPGLRNLSYQQRLLILELRPLHFRRIVYDLSVCYKIVHGLLDSSLAHLITPKHFLSTRGHNLRLQPLPFRSDFAKFSFPARAIRFWNALPVEIVNAPSTLSFTIRLNSLPSDFFDCHLK